MSDTAPRAGKIRNVFEKVAKGELVPNNFGSCLLTAVAEGLTSKQRLAAVLGTDPDSIRKAGNNLKPREIAAVAKRLTKDN